MRFSQAVSSTLCPGGVALSAARQTRLFQANGETRLSPSASNNHGAVCSSRAGVQQDGSARLLQYSSRPKHLHPRSRLSGISLPHLSTSANDRSSCR
ncbi:hypothetical protein OH76DRAFT_1184306 [Lentinus brumalis]|uniref:Uncharacterized protein n=1 Tax=Lentinus brumalis TaxID=2498619 RepID=A0A371CU07_9APHY|nr:hypothetical protein OH76DRAFT_1184306 [Polyporus brumalis]